MVIVVSLSRVKVFWIVVFSWMLNRLIFVMNVSVVVVSGVVVCGGRLNSVEV